MDVVGGEGFALMKMIFALLFVLGLMGGLYLILKKLGLSGHVQNAGAKKRLKVVESVPIDPRRRLVIIQRDDVQHLVIVGPNSETVVETDIPLSDNNAS